MALTRSHSQSSPSPQTPDPKFKPATKPKATNKRKANDSTSSSQPSPAKRGRPSKAAKAAKAEMIANKEKEQMSIEESMGKGEADGKNENSDGAADGDEKIVEGIISGEGEKNSECEVKGEIADEKNGGKSNGEDGIRVNNEKGGKTNSQTNGQTDKQVNGKPNEKNAFDEVKSSPTDAKNSAKEEQEGKSHSINQNNNSIDTSPGRESSIPSSILEKGIIYFFFRSRVGITSPHSVSDVARSYIVLRPLPLGAKIGEGPLEDRGDARLLVLPKKVLPASGKDRFLMFVGKAKATIGELRGQFEGVEYATKTSGTSNSPPATPFAEGIYALTSTGRTSHLAYHITSPSPFPSSSSTVQESLHLHEKGSFILSVKNPEVPSPANVTIGNPAKYPKEVQEKFRGLRWMPAIPEVLEYEGTQVLVVGEGMDEFGDAVEEQEEDKGDREKEKPEEEIERLEDEDHDRVEHLKEDDPVFADLGMSSKEYPHLQTTW